MYFDLESALYLTNVIYISLQFHSSCITVTIAGLLNILILLKQADLVLPSLHYNREQNFKTTLIISLKITK